MKKELLLTVFMVIIGFCVMQFVEFSGPDAPVSTVADGGARLSQLLGSNDLEGYEKAIGPRTFRFPDDHGPHPRFRNEWWYVTGNLDSADQRRFGFELTFFRFALSPEPAPSRSSWRSNQVYIAHFAITDVAADRIHVLQRFSRGAAGLAGARERPFAVWIEDWSIRAGADNPQSWQLSARDLDLELTLDLTPTKPPVLNGIDGLSRKSSVEGNASYYYSISRMNSKGWLRTGDESYAVSGLSWLDREWSSSALGDDQQGWDWFALQLSDGSDLMFYNIRKTDGAKDAHSAGTWIDPDGNAQYLGQADVELVQTGLWESPLGGTYPSGWEIRVPRHDLLLRVTPVISDQELSTTVRYWEGAVDVAGQRSRDRVTGRGYVELTGYAR